MPSKLIEFLSCLKNAEDRLYNATIIETIECILITINSKRRDFSFAKYWDKICNDAERSQKANDGVIWRMLETCQSDSLLEW